MNIIVAVDKNWGIGKDGDELVNIPKDKQLMRDETLGKVIVMGKKTFLSLPGAQPLYGRTNIVLSSEPAFSPKGVIVVKDMDAALETLKDYKDEDIYILGGESIYKQFLPYCKVAHVTAIDYEYEADAYMPNLDKDKEWELAADSDEETYFDLTYTFKLYIRKNCTI